MNRFTRWIFEITEDSTFAFLVVAVVLIGCGYLMAGCSTINISTPEGYQASYTRIGNQDISGLRFEKGSLGLYRLTLDKQSSDSDVLGLIRQLVTK